MDFCTGRGSSPFGRGGALVSMTCFYYNEDGFDFQSHTPLPRVGAGDRRPVYPEGSALFWCTVATTFAVSPLVDASFNVTDSLLIAARVCFSPT